MMEPKIFSRDLRDNCPEPTSLTAAPKPLLMAVAMGKPFGSKTPEFLGIYRAIAAAIARE